MNEVKYICVGNSKTGTTSLLKAFRILGFRCASYDLSKTNAHLNGFVDDLVTQAENFNFLKDWPWRFLYKEIDKKYNNCKFILTIRDENEWVKSYINHVRSLIPIDPITTKYRIEILGFNPVEYLNDKNFLIENVYRKNNNDVLNYLKGREKDMLIIDITKENRWDSLCSFIGERTPNIKFPHENKS